MEKKEQLYEGKAKKVYATEDPSLVIVSYKDDATALDGLKKGSIAGKGSINNRMSNYLMELLEKEGVPTHFVEELSDRETLVRRVTIVPLEVIIRNISAGSFAKRYGVEEGIVFAEPTIEFSYKNDSLHDPVPVPEIGHMSVFLRLRYRQFTDSCRRQVFALRIRNLRRVHQVMFRNMQVSVIFQHSRIIHIRYAHTVKFVKGGVSVKCA